MFTEPVLTESSLAVVLANRFLPIVLADRRDLAANEAQNLANLGGRARQMIALVSYWKD
jgi:hypothetical protein